MERALPSHGRSRRMRQAASFVALVIATLAVGATSSSATLAPLQTTSYHLHVALSPSAPVALRDLDTVFRPQSFGGLAADLSAVPAGVRVIVPGQDAHRAPAVVTSGSADPREQSDKVGLLDFDGCVGDPCHVTVRIVFELVDPRDPIAFDVPLVATSPPDPPAGHALDLRIGGTDTGPTAGAPWLRSAAPVGGHTVLDVDHPLAAYRVDVDLVPGTPAPGTWALFPEATWRITDTRTHAPPLDVAATVRMSSSVQAEDVSRASLASCVPLEPCRESTLLVLEWRGAPGTSTSVEWDVAAAERGYGPAPAPEDARASLALVDHWVVPESARFVDGALSGTIDPTIRGNSEGPLVLATLAVPGSPLLSWATVRDGSSVTYYQWIPGRAPGIPAAVTLDISVTRRDGTPIVEPTDAQIAVLVWQVQLPYTDGLPDPTGRLSVPLDRSRRTVSFDPFLGCVTGVSCRAAFELVVASTSSWQPPDVLVHWTVRVHATAFGGYLTDGTTVELE